MKRLFLITALVVAYIAAEVGVAVMQTFLPSLPWLGRHPIQLANSDASP